MVAVKAIAPRVKDVAITLYKRKLLPLTTILSVVRFSRATFFRALQHKCKTGMPAPLPSRRRGRKRLVLRPDLAHLLNLIRTRTEHFLDELMWHLRRNRFLSVHFTTIFRELERQDISHKRLHKIAAERNEPLRMDYLRRMNQYTPEQLGFIDETSKDERTVGRRFGWSKRGTRAESRQPFVRATRLTATGLMSLDGMVTNRVIIGSMKRKQFVEFLEQSVMPLTSPFPGPLSVLVMDNAKIHHGAEIQELAERFGVRIEYLPPYSPDFNPIEEAFSKIKAFLRRNNDIFRLKRGRGAALLYDMQIAMEIITAQDAYGYFRHAGYC
uniref:Tc1-mariner class transposase n=1 Tax=Mycena chlorophos TaxID=658473 RepID=A0ABQ0LB68_MYCCL|nr:Tc1-mariner class transposase [Mycena chlorophos]